MRQVLGLVSVASAASPHYKGDKSAGPTITDIGASLRAAGSVTGLGNGDLTITLTATVYQPETAGKCTNPGSQDKVPGQNPATVSGSVFIPGNEIKNGNLSFSVVTATDVPGAPACPNGGWTQTITALSVTSATLTFSQAGGDASALNRTCAAPTNDGVVHSHDGDRLVAPCQ
jgi:hypothetical protein